jgi:peptide deformylase
MSEDKKVNDDGVVSFPSIFDDSESVPVTHDTNFSVFGEEHVNKEQQNANFAAFSQMVKGELPNINERLGGIGAKAEVVSDIDRKGLDSFYEGKELLDVVDLGPDWDKAVENAALLQQQYASGNQFKLNALSTPQTLASNYVNKFLTEDKPRKLTEDEIKKARLYSLINRFTLITDANKSFSGFGISGAYNFDEPPIVQFSEDFAIVMEPKLLAEVLQTLAVNLKMPSLHACQIGLKYDVFVIRHSQEKCVTYFNSQLLGVSEEGVKEYEGSASYPLIDVKIDRPKHVEIMYLDEKGEEWETTVSNHVARYAVHNYALSRGKTYLDFASDLQVKRAYKKREKLLKKRDKNEIN